MEHVIELRGYLKDQWLTRACIDMARTIYDLEVISSNPMSGKTVWCILLLFKSELNPQYLSEFDFFHHLPAVDMDHYCCWLDMGHEILINEP